MKAFVINLESRPERMVDFQKNIFPFPVERFNAIRSDPGWVGCANSHLAIMQQQYEFPFVIFEDDCVMVRSWNEVEEAMMQLPPDWDALWLGCSQIQTLERYSQNLCRAKGFYCHHAVIYNSRPMIDYYLNNHPQSGLPIDDFSASTVSHHFNCFLIDPLAALQTITFSDIEGKVNDYTPWFNNIQNLLNNTR